MMQINQDTFKEGKLSFGMSGSAQRNAVYAYRHIIFNDLILEDFPEYYLMLQGDMRTVQTHIRHMVEKTKFKYMSKFACSLAYTSLETVGSNEFEAIAKRFKRFLKQHSTVNEELRNTFLR